MPWLYNYDLQKNLHVGSRAWQLDRMRVCLVCRRSGFDPQVRQNSFVEISHEIVSTAILSLPLIQIGQLSVAGEKDVHKVLVTLLKPAQEQCC